MRIGFDAKRAMLNHSGLGNYSRTLITSLIQEYPQNEYYLYSPSINDAYKNLFSHNNVELITPTSFIDRNFQSYWRSYKIANAGKSKQLDIYHGLSQELPIGIERTGVKTIVTIHDVIFDRYPEHYNYLDRISYRKKVQYACTIADKIVCISKQTADDIAKYYQAPIAKISVIYQSCDSIFYQANDEKHAYYVKHRYNLPDQYILHVGSYNKRKNHEKLLYAYHKIKNNSDIKLVLVGSGGSEEQHIRKAIHQMGLIQNVILIQKANNLDLSYIYKAASMLVYNSLFEGFGIPILEGFASGIPVITSTGSCFTEVGGNACIYTEPSDESALAEAIKLLLTNTETKKQLIAAGYEQLKKFDTSDIAESYMNLYEQLNNL